MNVCVQGTFDNSEVAFFGFQNVIKIFRRVAWVVWVTASIGKNM